VATFLLRSHCQRLSTDDFLCVSTGQRPGASSMRHRSFQGAREMRETRRRLSACVRVHAAHFENEF